MSEEMRRRAKAMAEEAEALGLNEREFRVACSIGIDVIQRTLKLHEETHRAQVRREVVEQLSAGIGDVVRNALDVPASLLALQGRSFTAALTEHVTKRVVEWLAEQEANDGK